MSEYHCIREHVIDLETLGAISPVKVGNALYLIMCDKTQREVYRFTYSSVGALLDDYKPILEKLNLWDEKTKIMLESYLPTKEV